MEAIELIKALLKTASPEVLGKILSILFPDLAAQIETEIVKLRKERDEKKTKFLKALADNDWDTCNQLIAELLG